jgi:TonB family protein
LRTRNLILLLMIATSTLAFGEDSKTIEGRLNAKLQNQYLMFRVPRSGQKLRFSEDGSSKNPIGIRGLDELVQVNSVKVGKNELVLKGPRLQNSFSAEDQTVKLTRLLEPIEVHLALTDATSEAAIAKSYHNVFLRSDEIPHEKCSDYKYVAEFAAKITNSKIDVKPSRWQEKEPVEVCLPSGATAWRMGKGMTPPKAIKDPDPSYGNAERAAHAQGTFQVLIRIDETGKITDAIALGTASAGFQQQTTGILNKWRFKPAEKDGIPVASIVEVDVNFHMTR